MNQRLSQEAAKSRSCPVCTSSKFKLVKTQFEPMGLGVMRLEQWRCGKCHFVSNFGKLVKNGS